MTKRVDISEYLREYRERGEIVLIARWAMDGAETLAQAAELLRQFAAELDALISAGFHLMGPVEDDFGFAHRAEEGVSERLPRPQHGGSMHQLNEESAPLMKR